MEIANAGPVDAELHADLARSGVDHRARNNQRVYAAAAIKVEILEPGLLRGLSAGSGSQDDRGSFAEFRRELRAGIGGSFARGDHRKLRESIEMILPASEEMSARIVTADFRGIVKPKSGRIDRGDLANRGSAALERTPRFLQIESRGADDANAGDCDSAIRHPLVRRRRRGSGGAAVVRVHELANSLDDVVDGANVPRIVVGNGDVELALELK